MTATIQPTQPESVLRPRLAVTALFLANGSGIGLWAATIAPIKLLYGLTDFQLSMVLLAFAIGAILTMTMTGHIAARYGSARVALLTGLAFIVVVPIPAFMPNLVLLAAAILLFGACNGAMDVAMNGHGAVVEKLYGKPIMSSFHAAFSLGCLVGAAAGSAILAAGYGPTATMSCAALWGALLVIGFASSLKVPETGPREEAVGFALPSRAALLVGSLAFLTMFAEGAIADWAGVYLVQETGTTTAIAAWGYGSFAVTMMIGRFAGDRIVHAFGTAKVVTLGSALAVVGLAIPLAFPEVETAIVGYALAGIGIANIIPVMFSAGGRVTPDHPAIGVAMAATCGYAGFLLSPPLIGVFAETLGLRIALISLGVALLVVALAAPKVLRKA
jgi:MFS family permease